MGKPEDEVHASKRAFERFREFAIVRSKEHGTKRAVSPRDRAFSVGSETPVTPTTLDITDQRR